MGEIRILGGKEIREIFNLELAVKAVEQAYSEKTKGAGSVWPMVFHEFDPGHADLDIKSGNLSDIYGLKVVSWFESNPAKELPALYGTSLIFDITNGAPKALLNAGPITDLRTGAAGAIGAKLLARKDSEQLLMIGCGELSSYLIGATLFLMPQIKRVVITNPRHPEKVVGKVEAITEKVDALLEQCGKVRSASISAEADIEKAVRNSDIILTATPSREPMVRCEWVKPGTHFSCVGSDMSGKQEIASEILRDAKVFGDDLQQCFSVGECEIPHKQGVLEVLDGEIGEVICGSRPGRTNQNEITVFDSTGIALQDIASASAILKIAEEKQMGTVTEL